MALRWMEGFELIQDGDDLNYKYSDSLIYGWNGAGRITGTRRSVQLSVPSDQLSISLNNQSTWVVGFGMNVSLASEADRTMLQFYSGETLVGRFTLECTESHEGYGPFTFVAHTHGAGDSLLGTSDSFTLDIDTWYFFEYKYYSHTSGSFAMRLDEEEVSFDTSSGNTGSGADKIVITTGVNSYYLDDVHILDGSGTTNNDFIGDKAVMGVFTDYNEESTHTEWTPVGVDDEEWSPEEYPSKNTIAVHDENGIDGDTTYIYGEEVDTIDSYKVWPISPIIKSDIVGIQIIMTARNTSASKKSVATIIRSGSTDYEQSTQEIPSQDYGPITQIVEKNPATDAAWTSAQLDACEFGVKIKV